MSPELEAELRRFFGKQFYFIGSMMQTKFPSDDEAKATLARIRRMIGVVHGSPQQELPLS